MSQTSDTPETRKPCRYCGHPEANAKDWEEIEPGKGEELGLCWDGEVCRHDAEAAINRLMSERDAAREDARRLAEAMHLIVKPLGDETETSGNPCVSPNPEQGRVIAKARAPVSPSSFTFVVDLGFFASRQ